MLRWEPKAQKHVFEGNGRFVLGCAEAEVQGGARTAASGPRHSEDRCWCVGCELGSVAEPWEEGIRWPRGAQRVGHGQKNSLEGSVTTGGKGKASVTEKPLSSF